MFFSSKSEDEKDSLVKRERPSLSEKFSEKLNEIKKSQQEKLNEIKKSQQEKLNEITKQQDEIKKSLQDLRAEITKQQDEIKRSQQDLRAEITKQQDELKKSQQDLRAEITKQQDEIAKRQEEITKLQQNVKKLQEAISGVRCVLAPATTQAMAETCIYKQAEGLTSRLISQGMVIWNGQEGLQYSWSQVGKKVLDELLLANEDDQALEISWEQELFGGKDNSEFYAQELRMEAICAILSGLTYFAQTVPSSTLLSWPRDRGIFSNDGAYLNAFLGSVESKSGIQEETKKVVGVIQSWVPSEIPFQKVPEEGGDYNREQTRREIVKPFLESVVDELKKKLPGDSIVISRLDTTKQSVLRELCRK